MKLSRSSAALFKCFLMLAVIIGLAPAAGANALLFTPQRAEKVLRQFVLDHSPWKSEDIEIIVADFPAPALPAGTAHFRVLRPVKGVPYGMVNFLLAIDVAKKEEARLWIKAEIRVFEDVVVTSAPLANRDPIKAQDLRLERRDVSGLNARPFNRIEDVVGQQAMRAIGMNEIVMQKNVERPSLLRNGSAVTLVYETATLRAESPGLAVEAGKRGDTIQVKNASSGKLLRGVVIDGRSVRVN